MKVTKILVLSQNENSFHLNFKHLRLLNIIKYMNNNYYKYNMGINILKNRKT